MHKQYQLLEKQTAVSSSTVPPVMCVAVGVHVHVHVRLVSRTVLLEHNEAHSAAVSLLMEGGEHVCVYQPHTHSHNPP